MVFQGNEDSCNSGSMQGNNSVLVLNPLKMTKANPTDDGPEYINGMIKNSFSK